MRVKLRCGGTRRSAERRGFKKDCGVARYRGRPCGAAFCGGKVARLLHPYRDVVGPRDPISFVGALLLLLGAASRRLKSTAMAWASESHWLCKLAAAAGVRSERGGFRRDNVRHKAAEDCATSAVLPFAPTPSAMPAGAGLGTSHPESPRGSGAASFRCRRRPVRRSPRSRVPVSRP